MSCPWATAVRGARPTPFARASGARLRSSHSHHVVTCRGHQRELSRLSEALDGVNRQPVESGALPSGELAEQMLSLRERWSEQDQQASKDGISSSGGGRMPSGMRMVGGDALEIDFSVFQDEADGPANEDQTFKRVPREVKYFDTAAINIRAGDGGKGCCAFRREKFTPHGGPAGGNGGNGGSVWAVADEGLNSLSTFRNRVHWKAKAGVNGSGKDMHGANAEDLFIKVPPGIIIRRQHADDDEAPLAELLRHGDKALLAQGGRGGRGNGAFKSGKNNAPVIAEDGEQCEEEWLNLELKLIADVGVVGMPNAGKSTLLSVLSNARPKIADYPFTTLVPNLGVCDLDFRTTVFADVPGLIVGAHRGEGLGHEFLRHVSRARALVHVLDGTSADPVGDFAAIREELALAGAGALADKPYVVAYNKVDVPESGDYADDVREELAARWGVREESFVAVSAATSEGVVGLACCAQVRQVRDLLDAMPAEELTLETDAVNQQAKARTDADAARLDEFSVEAELAEERTWYVHGAALERFAQMTNWDYFEAVLRFQRVLKACGLWRVLERRGALEGDTVVIGDVAFRWSSEQGEGKLYSVWKDDLDARGRTGKGTARWPHMAG